MADVDLTPVDVPGTDGAAIALQTVDLADEYLFPNDGRTLLLVEHGTGVATLTLHTETVLDGLALPDKTVNLAANARRVVGPFNPDVYNDSDGKVRVVGSSANTKLSVIRYR